MGLLTTTLLALVSTGAVAAPAAKAADPYCSEMTGLCYSEYVNSNLGVTYRIAVPADAEGEYDIALQITASKSVGWAAIAWGGQMANNPITLAWANGDEVVVSSRMATGHTMPTPYDGATYTMLPDTMVAEDGTWTLSVVCSGCSSWSGGMVDASSTTARFAYGMSSTPPTTPADPNSNFGIHQAKGGWEHDMTAAANADFAALIEAAMGGEETEEPTMPMC